MTASAISPAESPKAIYWVVAEISPSNAGYRVRTAPLVEALGRHCPAPTIIAKEQFIASIEKIAAEASIVVLSKPSDTMTLLCMKHLMRNGVRVLVDLFDNYYSWSPSLFQQAVPWQWLRVIEPEASYGVIASTPFIADAVTRLGCRNVCVVGDAAPDMLSGGGLEESTLGNKWRDTDQIEVLWFGISGNPYFQAGVENLISWSRVVASLRDRFKGRQRIRLTICTNAVPEVDAAMKFINRESVDTRFVPWTAERCEELLWDSHLVLLPSDLSEFSLSKTHNRCSDAIARQCLVLASPCGPYQDIPGAVYRDVEALCDDLVAWDRSTISRRLAESASYIARTFVATDQARKLAIFMLRGLDNPGRASKSGPRFSPRVLVAGPRSPSQAVKLSRKLGYLTACFAGSENNLNFDFLLRSPAPTEGKVALKITALGRAALDSIWLNANEELEAQWENSPGDGTHLLTLRLPQLRSGLEAAEALRPIAHLHPDLRARQYDINVEIILTVLRTVGFDRFEYCTENRGGWEAFARLGSPALGEAAQKLRQHWEQVDAGQPVVVESLT